MYTKKVIVVGDSGAAGAEMVSLLKAHRDFEPVCLERDVSPVINPDIFAVVLCLHDQAAADWLQSATLPEDIIVINAGYACRFSTEWVYGYRFDRVVKEVVRSKAGKGQVLIANPGCFATGMQLLLRPLHRISAVTLEQPLLFKGFTGYSAGGKQAILSQAQYGTVARETNLTTAHGHTREVQHVLHRGGPLLLQPTVLNFLRGQRVELTLHRSQLAGHSQETPMDEWVYFFSQFYASDTSILVKAQLNDKVVVEDIGLRLKEGYLGAEKEALLSISMVEDWVTFAVEYDNLKLGASGNILKWLEFLNSL